MIDAATYYQKYGVTQRIEVLYYGIEIPYTSHMVLMIFNIVQYIQHH